MKTLPRQPELRLLPTTLTPNDRVFLDEANLGDTDRATFVVAMASGLLLRPYATSLYASAVINLVRLFMDDVQRGRGEKPDQFNRVFAGAAVLRAATRPGSMLTLIDRHPERTHTCCDTGRRRNCQACAANYQRALDWPEPKRHDHA